jgi:hypothetical protein
MDAHKFRIGQKATTAAAAAKASIVPSRDEGLISLGSR